MKIKSNHQKWSLASLLGKFSKSLIVIFESGEKKEFQRLKAYISS